MDMEKIRRDMTVTDRIIDREPLGQYINKECDNFDLYKLEKATNVAGGSE